jgi:ubiquinone biosynthesis monooxygenase Coq7
MNDTVQGHRLRLPGRRLHDRDIERMLRVDHAGERGAVKIYAGQLAVLGASALTSKARAAVEHMAAQEEHHLETFERLLHDNRVRPTALMPLWDIAGYTLGAVTALIGEKAAMACTVAVEDVIDAHYTRQYEQLRAAPEKAAEIQPLMRTVEEFRREELEHRDLALAHDADSAPGYALLTGIIRVGCRLAIRLSERF